MATDGPPSFTPGRRWRVGLNVLASILALLAILAMVNFLAARHSRRLQWSAHDRAQLSPVTREVLRSVTNQVKVIVFFDRTKPLFDMVADLLAQYRTECHKLELEFVDYERSLGRAKTIQTDYGLTSVADGDRIIFASGESKRVVYAKDLSEFDYKAIMRGEGEARRTGFKGEQLFTSALYSLMDTRPVTVYFLQGHREHDPSDTDDRSGYSRFAQLLSESQIAFAKLEPTALVTKEVPADCHLLVIANPVTPLHPAELANVQKYLDLGGRLLVLLSLDSLREPNGLERLLANWGVDVGQNLVTEDSQGRAGDPQDLLVSHFGNHGIVNPLGRSRLLMIAPRSISTRAKAPQSADAPKVTELATTGPDGVATRVNGRIERQGVAIPLMAAVEKGAIQGITADRGAARIVVTGDSYFLVNKLIVVEANRDLARNAINWLLNRDVLVAGIGTKAIKEYRVVMTASELTALRWLFLAAFPGGVLLLGFVVWFRRRI